MTIASLDRESDWRWRLRDTNGKIIADSGEGYNEGSDCRAGIRNVIDCCKNDPPVQVI